MTEHLHYFLTSHELFDIAVHFTERLLLLDKVGRTFSADVFGYKKQYTYHHENQDCQISACVYHRG